MRLVARDKLAAGETAAAFDVTRTRGQPVPDRAVPRTQHQDTDITDPWCCLEIAFALGSPQEFRGAEQLWSPGGLSRCRHELRLRGSRR